MSNKAEPLDLEKAIDFLDKNNGTDCNVPGVSWSDLTLEQYLAALKKFIDRSKNRTANNADQQLISFLDKTYTILSHKKEEDSSVAKIIQELDDLVLDVKKSENFDPKAKKQVIKKTECILRRTFNARKKRRVWITVSAIVSVVVVLAIGIGFIPYKPFNSVTPEVQDASIPDQSVIYGDWNGTWDASQFGFSGPSKYSFVNITYRLGETKSLWYYQYKNPWAEFHNFALNNDEVNAGYLADYPGVKIRLGTYDQSSNMIGLDQKVVFSLGNTTTPFNLKVTPRKLEKPKITEANYNLEWSYDGYAEAYEIYSEADTTHPVATITVSSADKKSTYTYSMNALPANLNYSIKAVGDGKCCYSSDLSDPVKVAQLNGVSDLTSSLDKKMISWSAVEGASKYCVSLNGFSANTTNTFYRIPDSWFVSGSNQVLISAISENGVTLSSKAVPLAIDIANVYNISYSYRGIAAEFNTAALVSPGNANTHPAFETMSLNVASCKGYHFVRWIDASDGTEKVIDQIDAYRFSDLKLIGVFEPVTYRVKYLDSDKNSELTDMRPVSYTIEDSDISLPTPTKAGYTFSGWIDSETQQKRTSIAHGTTGDVVLIASWGTDSYSITYSFEGVAAEFASGITQTNQTAYSIESDEIVLSDAVREGYTFVGWYDGVNKVTSIPAHSTGNRALVGKFVPKSYSILYYEAKAHFVAQKNTFTIEDATFDLETPSEAGYVFTGWLDTATQQKRTSVVHGTTGDIALTAEWNTQRYSISYTYQGIADEFSANIKNLNQAAYTVESNEIVLTDASRDGYDFLGWYNGTTKVTSIATGSTGDFSLVGKFVPKPYSITYYEAKSSFIPTRNSFTIEDDTFNLETPSENGYLFKGWVDTSTQQKRVSVSHGTIGNIVVTATWNALSYQITYSYSGISSEFVSGVKNSNPAAFTIETSDIILSDASREGYDFLGWYNGTTKITTITKGSLGNLALVGKFAPKNYGITYKNLKGANTPAPISYTIESNTITLPSVSNNEYSFSHWTNENGQSQTQIIHGSLGDVSFSAVWGWKGTGVTTSPYEIYNESQLRSITDFGASYILKKDISLTSSWHPLASSSTPFTGVFDGNGHTVTLYATNTGSVNFGLFDTLGVGTVKNLTIQGTITSLKANCFGAIAGVSSGMIQNCVNRLNCAATDYSDTDILYAGGIVGQINGGKISQCTNSGSIAAKPSLAKKAYCGGIAGYGSNGLLWQCMNSGNISSDATDTAFSGGLLGTRANVSERTLIGESDVTTSSINTGSIIATNATNKYYGQIIGYENYIEDAAGTGSPYSNQSDGWYYVSYKQSYVEWFTTKYHYYSAWMMLASGVFDTSKVNSQITLNSNS